MKRGGIKISLGKILRTARLKQNYTLKELQEISGLKYWYISKLELEKHTPKPETLKVLAISLNLDLNFLLVIAGYPPEGMKTCSKCNQDKLATTEIFALKNCKLNARCRDCIKEDKAISYLKNLPSRKAYLKKNEQEIKNYKKQYRDVKMEAIKQYNNDYMPKYYQVNKDVLKEKQYIYYENQKEEFSRRRKVNYRLNREYEKEYMKKYREVTDYNVKYYWKNRDNCLSLTKEWFINNPHKIAYYHNRRRAFLRSLECSLTGEQWGFCLEYFDNRDAYTGLPLNRLTQDHIIPVSKGGGYSAENIIPCNKNINSSKSNKDMEKWFRKQSFFSELRLIKIYSYIDEARKRFSIYS